MPLIFKDKYGKVIDPDDMNGMIAVIVNLNAERPGTARLFCRKSTDVRFTELFNLASITEQEDEPCCLDTSPLTNVYIEHRMTSGYCFEINPLTKDQDEVFSAFYKDSMDGEELVWRIELYDGFFMEWVGRIEDAYIRGMRGKDNALYFTTSFDRPTKAEFNSSHRTRLV